MNENVFEAGECIICYDINPVDSLRPNPCTVCGDKNVVFYHIGCLNSAAARSPACPLCRTKLNITIYPLTKRDAFGFTSWILNIVSMRSKWKFKLSVISNVGSTATAIINIFKTHLLWKILYFATLFMTSILCLYFVLSTSGSSKEKAVIVMYYLMQIVWLMCFIVADELNGSNRVIVILMILLVIFAVGSSIVKKLQKLLTMYSTTRIDVFS